MLTNAPFGMRPVYHPTGLDRASTYTIGTGYATALYKGTPVVLNTDGTLNIGAVTADIIGVFDGVEFTDALGKPNYSNFWPAAQAGTNIVAWVWDDPDIVYEIAADGAIAATAVGAQSDFTTAAIGTGNATTGLSLATISSSVEAGGQQGQLRILRLAPYVNNAWGDAFTWVQVQIAQHQYVANKVSI